MSSVNRKIVFLLLAALIFSIYPGVTILGSEIPVTDVSGTSVGGPSQGVVQLNWYLPGEAPENFEKINEKLNNHLSSKIGTKVKFNFLEWEDFEDNKDILLSSNEEVDLIFTADWLSYADDARLGYYYPIGSLIDRLAPGTKAELGSAVMKGAEIDGELFALPVPGETSAYSSSIVFRKDLVKKYNITLNKIKKLSDAEPVLKLIKSKQPNLMPLVNNSYKLNYDLTGLESLETYDSVPGALSGNLKDNKIYNEFAQAGTMTFFKTLNSFYKAGYLKKSSNYYSDMNSGKIFSRLISNGNPLSESYSYGYEWIFINLGKPVFYGSAVTSSMNSVWCTSKYPERALSLMEYVYNDATSSNLLHFGIEGVNYVKVSGNVIDYPRNTGSGALDYTQSMNWMLGNRYFDFTWKNEDPDIYKKLKNFNKSATASRAMGFTYDEFPVLSETAACRVLLDKYIEKLMTGEYDPVKYLPVLNSSMEKAGLKNILAEKQRQFNTWLSEKAASDIRNSSGIKLLLGGEPLTLKYPPTFSKGVPMVPMKQFFDCLDATSDYNAKTKTITAGRHGKSLKLTLGSGQGTLDGKAVKLSASPEIINEQVYIPAESVSKLLGYNYKWNGTSKTAEISSGFTEAKGTTWGNIENYGYAVSDGDYQFISLVNEGMYRVRSDGSEKVKLFDKSGAFLNAAGGWLYFSNSDIAPDREKLRLYKMKTDGSSLTKLTDHEVSFVNLEGEWLYYINKSDGNRPYRINISGKGLQKLSDSAVSSLYADNGWLYYLKSSDNILYKMRTSGTDRKRLTETPDKNTRLFQKSGDWIFYYGKVNSKDGIYKMKSDGSSKKYILNASFDQINADGSNIYYNDKSGGLFVINEAERKKVKISYNIKNEISICGNWIYYTIYNSDKSLLSFNDDEDKSKGRDFRISTDGSVKQKIADDGAISDIYKMPSSKSYAPMPVNVPINTSGKIIKTAKEIVKHKDAVALIKTYDDNGELKGSGSGFNIDPSGIVVTNFHVISEASSIKCSFDNGITFDVDYVLNFSTVNDIAILKINSSGGLPVVNLGDSDKVELADDVLAIGNPMEMQNTISDGIISGIRSMFGLEYIQTTASISPGSSGGPLFNSYGEVIGITSMSILDSQNMNFAIPINKVKRLFAAARCIPVPAVNNYDNEVIEFEGNNSMETANELHMDSILSASVNNSGDVDYYELEIATDSKVNFVGLTAESVLGDSKDSSFEMKLLDRNGTVLYKSEAKKQEEIGYQNISADLKAGTYYLSVTGQFKPASSESDNSEYAIICIKN